MKSLSRLLVCFLFVVAFGDLNVIAEPPQRNSGIAKPRTGTTTPFGNGTITRRSDGTSARSSSFGRGTLSTERDKSGRTITGTTQPFGSGSITRWSDGTVTRTSPFGSGTLSRETSKDGKTVTSRTSPFGGGSLTTRSDGSSSRSSPFGKGTLQRDTPSTTRSRR